MGRIFRIARMLDRAGGAVFRACGRRASLNRARNDLAVHENTMPTKLRIGVIFGGRSAEHEVSLVSAASIMGALDKGKYEIVPIGITPQGKWISSADALAP
jgi:hypothetical protein